MKTLRLHAILLWCALACGCRLIPMRHVAQTPSVSIVENDKGKTVKVDGDAKVPSKVDTKAAESRIPIPEGTKVEFNESLGTLTFVLSKPSVFTSERKETDITGPVSHEPDKAPTIKEEMDAKSDFWISLGLRVGVAVGMAAAIFGLVRDWNMVMYGGASVAGACLFGLFVVKHPILLLIIGLGIAIAIAGPTIWHTKLKAKQPAKK